MARTTNSEDGILILALGVVLAVPVFAAMEAVAVAAHARESVFIIVTSPQPRSAKQILLDLHDNQSLWP